MEKIVRLPRGEKNQARKKNPNPNFLVRIFSSGVGGGTLPRERVGAKKFDTSSKPGKTNFLGRISRDFAGISRGRPKSLRKESCVQFPFPKIRQEKRARRLTFWVRRPPGGVGVFHLKGWWPKTSCLPSKVRLPWVSKGGIRDVPRILLGCPGPLAAFKKLVQKKFVCIFRSL